MHSRNYISEIVNNQLSFLKDLPGEEDLYRISTEKDDFVPPNPFDTKEYIESSVTNDSKDTGSRSGFENIERTTEFFSYYYVQTPDNQTIFNITVPDFKLFQKLLPNFNNFSVNQFNKDDSSGKTGATINFTIPAIVNNIEDVLKRFLPQNVFNVPVEQPNELEKIEDSELGSQDEGEIVERVNLKPSNDEQIVQSPTLEPSNESKVVDDSNFNPTNEVKMVGDSNLKPSNEVKAVNDLDLKQSNEDPLSTENMIIVKSDENIGNNDEPIIVILQEEVTEINSDGSSTVGVAIENRDPSLNEEDSTEFTTVQNFKRTNSESSISPLLKAIIHRHKWLRGWRYD